MEETKSRKQEFWDEYGTTILIVAYGLFCYNIGFKRGKMTALDSIDHMIKETVKTLNIQRF